MRATSPDPATVRAATPTAAATLMITPTTELDGQTVPRGRSGQRRAISRGANRQLWCGYCPDGHHSDHAVRGHGEVLFSHGHLSAGPTPGRDSIEQVGRGAELVEYADNAPRWIGEHDPRATRQNLAGGASCMRVSRWTRVLRYFLVLGVVTPLLAVILLSNVPAGLAVRGAEHNDIVGLRQGRPALAASHASQDPAHGTGTSRSIRLVTASTQLRVDEAGPSRPLGLMGSVNQVLAQGGNRSQPQNQLLTVLNNARLWLMLFLAGAATLVFTIGGFRYLIANGDVGEIEAAKRAFKGAAVGYALAALAPALVAILRSIVGV